MLSTARISVNIDGEIKQNAQRILSEIGMDLTTAIELLLRAIIREEKIPFELRTYKSYRGEMYRQFVHATLEESKLEAADPNTERLSHSDVMTMLKKQREARHGL